MTDQQQLPPDQIAQKESLTSADKGGLIEQRIGMHPNAQISDIVASLELDGIHVTADEVREVMGRPHASMPEVGGRASV